MRIGVFYRTDYLNSAKEVYTKLKEHFDVLFFKDSSEQLSEVIGGELVEPKVVISVGGDGTVLRVLKKVKCPVIGVKAGRLGFFSGYLLTELDKLVEDLKCWNFIEDRRWMLRVEIENGTFFAINDAVLQKDVEQKIVDFAVEMTDGSFFYHADGLVVSTPTGSSAYALALGGPIILPNVEAFEITPMAPQFLATRSLVIPSTEKIRITVNDTVNLVVDGDVVGKVREIHVRKCSKVITLLRPKSYDFSTSIKEKIGYGKMVLKNGSE
ncbi:NAD+ kinase [Fervidobacterium changbaicum]|uniref:NAD kinase n=2 Tax=Fervidobacterium TaxID=2422 RepID=A0AAI8CL46_FERIS|nr:MULTISPECIES: NAD(+) kinase [Fervidobacterium]AMW32240.1 NAD(+) kinase [Fervidobacterium islandicum]QAV32420.1 NAD(+) kinase [Fervidobacterium changbaicum]SDH18914.1 NAD+ kinase [Fervidobacterium changbaicum]